MLSSELSPSAVLAAKHVREMDDRGLLRRGPITGLILGSGLGDLADKIQNATIIPFSDIPGFGTTTAKGHRGQLIVGTLEDVTILAMAGRYHRYEGWTNDDVIVPVETMAALGADRLIVSNAAGGVNPKLRVGDIVVITDHINLCGGWFHFNRGDSPISTRIGSPADCYDPQLGDLAMKVAVEESFDAFRGTYLATLGPTYESRAEYRMMRRIGADVVGMSTAAEVLAASRLGMEVLGLSMVSNVANPDRPMKTDHTEVLEAGITAQGKMESIVRKVLGR